MFMNDINHKKNNEKCFIKVKAQSAASLQRFKNEITVAAILHKINTSLMADPNSNYNIIHEVIENVKKKKKTYSY